MSPLLHIKLQSNLVNVLASRFASPSKISTADHINDYIEVIQLWMCEQSIDVCQGGNPSHRNQGRLCSEYQRSCITIAVCQLILDPIRAYIAEQHGPEHLVSASAMLSDALPYLMSFIQSLQSAIDSQSQPQGRSRFMAFCLLDAVGLLRLLSCTELAGHADRSVNISEIMNTAWDMVVGKSNG